MTEHYSVRQWHGKSFYFCKYCRMDSEIEQEVVNHVNSEHLSTYSVRPAEGGLVADNGEPMHVVEEIPPNEPPVFNGVEDTVEAGSTITDDEQIIESTDDNDTHVNDRGSSGFRGMFSKE